MSQKLTVIPFLLVLFFYPTSARAEAPVGKAVAYVAKSKAARAFGGILAGYFVGKGLDKFFDTLGRPDQKEIDNTLIKLQTDHPEYRQLFGTLRRSIGPDTDKAAFENICLDVIEQFDRSQLKTGLSTPPNPFAVEPKLDWQSLALKDWSKLSTLPKTDLKLSTLFDEPSRLGALSIPRTTQLVLTPYIVGAWSFDYDNGELGFGDSYVFQSNGKVTRYQAIRDEVFAFQGTYTQSGKNLTIQWRSGLQEVGEIETIKEGHIKYKLTPADTDLQILSQFTLTRISDVGSFSMVSFKNPSTRSILFSVRWAQTDGTWSDWSEREIGPDSEIVSTSVGGFYCVVGFDASHEEGIQGIEYALPFAVTTPEEREKLSPQRRYTFTTDGPLIDLKIQ